MIDTKPRKVLDDACKATLKIFADMVVERLEQRRAQIGPSQEELQYLEEARLKSESAAAAKSEFIDMISHELRTPLNAIIGFSGMLADESLGPIGHPSYLEFATTIRDSGKNLSDLVCTILEFADAEQGNIKLVETEFPISEVVKSVLHRLSEQAGRLRVTVSAKPICDALLLRADRRYVTRMLMAVIGNAIKFNRPLGTVAVSAEVGEDHSLHVYITDTGVGMSPKAIDRLNTPFAQADGCRARKFEGIGLDLTFTRRLLALHGGSLSVQSRVGEGTCVVLQFPCERVTVSHATNPSTPAEMSRHMLGMDQPRQASR